MRRVVSWATVGAFSLNDSHVPDLQTYKISIDHGKAQNFNLLHKMAFLPYRKHWFYRYWWYWPWYWFTRGGQCFPNSLRDFFVQQGWGYGWGVTPLTERFRLLGFGRLLIYSQGCNFYFYCFLPTQLSLLTHFWQQVMQDYINRRCPIVSSPKNWQYPQFLFLMVVISSTQRESILEKADSQSAQWVQNCSPSNLVDCPTLTLILILWYLYLSVE